MCINKTILKYKKLCKSKDCELFGIIQKLLWDDIFDIYSRQGIFNYIEFLQKDINVYLLDFVKISELNSKFSYEYVNELFKKSFNELKKNNIIFGRCYLGDEIIVINENVDINKIKKVFNKNKLSFRYIKKFYKYNEKSVGNFIKNLSDELHKKEREEFFKNKN